jgi:hypothetical protein
MRLQLPNGNIDGYVASEIALVDRTYLPIGRCIGETQKITWAWSAPMFQRARAGA